MDTETHENDVTFRFPGVIGPLEEAFEVYCRDHEGMPSRMRLDLSDCRFVEVTSLMWMLAILSLRERGGVPTEVIMPREKAVRDFMRVWEFPEAVRYVLGRPFTEILSEQDRGQYDREEKDPIDRLAYAGKVLDVDGIEQRLLSEGFFNFMTFTPRREKAPSRLADNENSRWREDRILSVLDKHLTISGTTSGTTVSSHIVHEAMMNALRHPNCRLIQTSSFFDRPDNYLLGETDLKDWRSFFKTLYDQLEMDGVNPSKWIWTYMPDNVKRVKGDKKNIPLRKDHGQSVVDALNAAIKDRCFYEAEHFKGVRLPVETASLLRRLASLKDIEIQKFNRYMIEACFPGNIEVCSKGYLTIVYRDDGESAIDTLLNAIQQRKSIRSMDPQEFHTGYLVNLEDENTKKGETQKWWSNFTPQGDSPEEIVLLTTFFPGITRDIFGVGHKVHPDVPKKHPLLGYPGMGMYVLSSEAIDVFKGMVSLRTKRYFLNMRAVSGRDAQAGIRYSVKIKHYGDWCPEFPGNMLTIRLPLR